ncbi:DNA cytosine methyltransferase [Bosea sp. AS-1]|uniref:DNA cytosine methyltransferase n=1 Tax=Bosea sp. AS-1 TaxID=2015316 RepID=UPI000B796690|nr:DNA cytosine methyltransferase [Bosea sp. AS-1]
MKVLDLFSAAAGGWSLGMHRAGYRTVAACEVIDWRRALYLQNNPGVPVYDDVTTLTADRLVRDGIGLPDIIVGSPPCQDISSANTKGKGVDGERSGLYFEAIRLIGECRPRWFALENSANLRTRGADRVIDALAAIGYTCWPFVVSAGDIGANHERKRSWLVGFCIADADGLGRDGGRQGWWSGLDIPLSIDPRHANEVVQGPVRVLHGRSCAIDQGGVVPYTDDESELRGAEHAEMGKLQAVAGDVGNTANADEAGQKAGLLESSLRSTQEPDDGCCDGRRHDGSGVGQMGGCEGAGRAPAEPWAEWNGGLAHHLRVDDGLSSWVAQSRIAVGGPRGTVAASLIVEAFGDAVLPQIPEAIGRAIWRVEAALAALHMPAANDNDKTKETAA